MSGESFGEAFPRLLSASRAAPTVARKKIGKDIVRASSVRTAPEVFAARSDGRAGHHGCDRGHALGLKRALDAKPVDARHLDPITVYQIGEDDYCVDGHHRLAAYLAAGKDRRIAVTRMGGTLKDALAASVSSNAKDVLPMSRMERENAAWKLVTSGTGSKREQALWTGTSRSFIRALRELKTTLTGDEWVTLSEARKRGRDDEWSPEGELDEYVRRLRKTFGSKLHRRPDMVLLAFVEIIGAEKTADAIEHAKSQADAFAWAYDEIAADANDPEDCDF